ncbi:MAG: hypothetical protein E6Q76_19660 [Rhizobium sp.]|nr:MAG: hypothetical protein E6Q76_19660 [Rhizobium sp.]
MDPLSGWAIIAAVLLYGSTGVPVGWVLFSPCVALLFAHTAVEEIRGRFWRYYWGHFPAPWLSDAKGIALFLALFAALFTLAVLGLLCGSTAALSLLVGLMLADAVLSHGLLRLVFRREYNPGQWTAIGYAVLVGVVLASRLGLDVMWVAIGASPFVLFWLWSWERRVLAPATQEERKQIHMVVVVLGVLLMWFVVLTQWPGIGGGFSPMW